MAQQDPFQYPERISVGQFRLILLQPCQDVSAPLEVKLVTKTLIEYHYSIVNHYTALSYVWGDVKDKRTVSIDGKSLEITATLHSSLRHIRDPEGELKVWADGICINQADVEERNIQVQEMGTIYQLARHTIIYLGESTPSSEILFDVMPPITLENRGTGYMSNIVHLFEPKGDTTESRRDTSLRDSKSKDGLILDGLISAESGKWLGELLILVLDSIMISPR
jgi:hypothetical protein